MLAAVILGDDGGAGPQVVPLASATEAGNATRRERLLASATAALCALRSGGDLAPAAAALLAEALQRLVTLGGATADADDGPSTEAAAESALEAVTAAAAADSPLERVIEVYAMQASRIEPALAAPFGEPQPVAADSLECQLCFNLLYTPVTTVCGHTFCKV